MTTENIVIYQGATFTRNITLNDANNQPLNVVGYSANASMKIDPYANDAHSTLAVPVLFNVLLSNGNLQMTMNASDTADVFPGYYWYDVIIWNGTSTYRIGDGLAQVFPAISES